MLKSTLADLSTGFAALVLILVGFATGVLPQNLRTQVIVVSTLFLLAGLLRGVAASQNSWITGVWVGLGADVPVCIMAVTGAAFTSTPHLIAFLAMSMLASIAGTHARRLWRLAQPRASVAVGIAWIAVSLSIAQLFVPVMLERMSSARLKQMAPPFSFVSLDGGQITNQSLRGRVNVLAFWATWCVPCREELPRINALYGSFAMNSNVAFLAVDSEGEGADFETSAAKAREFFSKAKLSIPIAVDNDSRKSLGVHGLPALLIIDRQGNIRFIHTGYDGSENLERILKKQITELLSSPDG